MGGRGSKSSRKGQTQIPTKAKAVENMNEAQIKQEIEKLENKITKLNETIDSARTPTQYEQAVEDFPLGVGYKDAEGIKRLAKSNQQSIKKATQLKEALNEQKTANKQLQDLKNTQKQIQGTGKNLTQIEKEKTQKAVKALAPTRKWEKIQDAKMSQSGYMPRIIKSGDYKIQGSDGMYTIYKNDKMLARTDKLTKAKAYVEAQDK